MQNNNDMQRRAVALLSRTAVILEMLERFHFGQGHVTQRNSSCLMQ